MLHAAQVLLPAPDAHGEAVPGRELRPAIPAGMFGALTSLGRAAATRFNELGRKPGARPMPGAPDAGDPHAPGR